MFALDIYMAISRPGGFNISCRACLENARIVGDEGKFGSVNAVIFASRLVNHSAMVACTLRFCQCKSELHAGIYDISANVRLFLIFFGIIFAKRFQVVAYCHEVVGIDAANPNENFKLMGDILDVHTCLDALSCQ
jgi:hypothetical protein